MYVWWNSISTVWLAQPLCTTPQFFIWDNIQLKDLKIFPRHLFINVHRSLVILLVTFHILQPWRRTDLTLLLKISSFDSLNSLINISRKDFILDQLWKSLLLLRETITPSSHKALNVSCDRLTSERGQFASFLTIFSKMGIFHSSRQSSNISHIMVKNYSKFGTRDSGATFV
jgi:hypothetical protein